jgi:hypothetical protein
MASRGRTILPVCPSRDRERGSTHLKTLFALAITVAMVYVGFKVVPPYMSNYRLEDSMKTEARYARANRKTPEDVQKDIYDETQNLGILVRREDIHVTESGGLLEVYIDYNVLVDLPGYQLTLHFHPQADSSSI